MGVLQQAQPASMVEATAPKVASRPRLLTGLTALTILGVLGGLYMALLYARTDVDQGDVQRIFYIHMPAFIGAFVAFLMTVVGGVMYLRTRNVKWDTLALSGVEVGFALGTINLLTGMIWSRPIWNTWWTWDPRLTFEVIMILTYAAYLMLRNGIENPETRRRFASVYGILAIITALMVLIIIRIRPDTIHPVVIGNNPASAQGGFALSASAGVAAALGVNMPVWGILIPVTLIWYRIRLQNLSQQVEAAKAGLLNRK